MKIEIGYKIVPSNTNKCVAQTNINGEPVFGLGQSWEEAKADLLKTLHSLEHISPPPATETVEL